MTHGALALRECAKRRNINQRELADLLGCSESLASMLLSGDRLPGRELTVKIEDMFGIAMRLWTLSARDEFAAVAAGNAPKRKIHKK